MCHLLALLGAHHIFHVSGLRVKSALHVSGDKIAHPQEHFLTVYTAFVQCTDIVADRSAAISVHCTKAAYTVKKLS